MRRAAAARRRRLRDEAALPARDAARPGRGPYTRATNHGRGARDRLSHDAPRHAADDEGCDRAVRAFGIPTNRLLLREPGPRRAVPGARSLVQAVDHGADLSRER